MLARWSAMSLVPDGVRDRDALAAELDELLAAEPPRPTWTATSLNRQIPAEYQDAVKACVHAIEAGELFQANICTRFTGLFDGEPSALFAEGVRRMRPRRA